MILLGSIVAGAQGVTLVPPAGFNTVLYCRLSNLSQGTLTLFNINPSESDTQYLLPNQQNIYYSTNTAQNPVVQSALDVPSVLAKELFAEWSTDPRNDFPGTYPCPVTVTAPVTANAIYLQGIPIDTGFANLASGLTVQSGGFTYRSYPMTNLPIGKPGVAPTSGTPPLIWTPDQLGGRASIFVGLWNDTGNPSAITISWGQNLDDAPTFGPPAITNLISQQVYSLLSSQVGTSPQLSVTSPVLGPYLQIATNGVSSRLNLTTSSQPTGTKPYVSNADQAALMLFNGIITNGTAQILTNSTTTTDFFVSNGGPIDYSAFGQVNGSFFAEWWTEQDTLAALPMLTVTGGTRVWGKITLPIGLVRIVFVPAASGSGELDMYILQGM